MANAAIGIVRLVSVCGRGSELADAIAWPTHSVDYGSTRGKNELGRVVVGGTATFTEPRNGQ